METSIKYFHSGMAGAPQISGTAGALKDVLDACLVNGWGLVSVSSIVVSGGIATATIPGGHSFDTDTIALISGAAVSALNGEKRLSTTSTGAITFPATGVPDGTVTGSITAKIAPLGWMRAFSGTNAAVYAPSDVTATGCLLRIDDTTTTTARAVGYESMTSLDVGSNAFPTAAQVSGGAYVPKSSQSNSTAAKWKLFGTGKVFHLWIAYNTATYPNDFALVISFGDFPTYRNPDPWCAGLLAATATVTYSSPGTSDSPNIGNVTATAGLWFARDYAGAAKSVAMVRRALIPAGATSYSGRQTPTDWPAGPDPLSGSVDVTAIVICEPGSFLIRSYFPGVHFCLNALGSGYPSGSVMTPISGPLSGRRLIALQIEGTSSASSSGRIFVDAAGPW